MSVRLSGMTHNFIRAFYVLPCTLLHRGIVIYSEYSTSFYIIIHYRILATISDFIFTFFSSGISFVVVKAVCTIKQTFV